MVTLTLNNPSGTVSNGVLTLSFAASQFLAVGTGTIAWARWFSSTNAFVADSDVGGMYSNAAIKIDNLEVFSGGRILVLSSMISEI